MPTLTVTSDKRAVVDNRILALAGEMGVTLTVVVDATIKALGTGKLTYIDFIQADGQAYYKGDYDCSSGTFNATLGAVDTILTYAGELSMQLVIRDALPPTGVEVWKSNKIKVVVEESVSATLPASYVAVPPMTAPTTFPAENVTLADAGSKITATNVEDALQEISDNISTIESLNINVKNYGAVGDGVTDDAPSIRLAILAAEESENGSTIFFPKGTYLVDSGSGTTHRGSEFVFSLSSNMILKGESNSVILFGDDMATKTDMADGMSLFIGEDVSNTHIYNLTLDMNGLNNLQTENNTYLVCYPIVFWNSESCSVQNTNILNCPGRNAILFGGRTDAETSRGGSNGLIRNNLILNGGTSIAGNTLQNDFSAIYCDAENSRIENNRIENTDYPFDYFGGIELHNNNIICQGNYFDKCIPAIYIASNFTTEKLYNAIVKNNIISKCSRGIYIVGSGDYENIIIRGNIFDIELSPNDVIALAHCIVMPQAVNTWTATNKINNLIITENIFTESYTTQQDAMYCHGIFINKVYGCIISNNQFYHLSGEPIILDGSPYDMENVDISNNQFKNFCDNTTESDHNGIMVNFGGSSTTPVKTAFDLTNVKIKENTFEMTVDLVAYATYAVSLNWLAGSVITQLVIDNNTLVNVETKRGTQSTYLMTPLYNLAEFGYTILANGLMMQWMKKTVNAGIGTPQEFTFPTPFLAAVDNIQITCTEAATKSVNYSTHGLTSVTVVSDAETAIAYIFVIGR